MSTPGVARQVYLNETSAALASACDDEQQLVTAFERFAFHIRVTHPQADDDNTAALEAGHALTGALYTRISPYAAEWVAKSCAAFAKNFGTPDQQRIFLRYAAMCCEALGLFQAALHYYQEALDARGPANDAWLDRSLHVSYATTCVSRCASYAA